MWRFRGLAAPYDVMARKSRKRWRIARTAQFDVPAVGVPLLHEHDNAQRLGRVLLRPGCRCCTVAVSGDGLGLRGWTRRPVTTGTGLSIGWKPTAWDVINGERVVRSAALEEVSIVREPAWPGCVITEVEEVTTWPRTLAHT